MTDHTTAAQIPYGIGLLTEFVPGGLESSRSTSTPGDKDMDFMLDEPGEALPR